ncbi:MAG: hypothetical protein DRI69_02010 [Bacteroidetes bacterium]|nr:MAG: hypothetical protein DRI69_02010 [Bacteroidota bacterium]
MKSFILCLAIVGIGFQIGSAQRYGPEQRAKMQERIESQRIAYITQKLDLTPDESAKFWPVYNEFKKLQKGKRAEVMPDKPLKELNEAEAEEMIEKRLAMEEEMIELKRDYFKNLKEVIPSTKIVLLVQIESAFNREVLEKLRQRQGQGQGQGKSRN